MVRVLKAAIALALTFAGPGLCHGSLKSIQVSGKDYLAWQVGQDDFVTPAPARYARRLLDVGPVPDFTGPDITCGAGGNIPAEGVIELKAGDKVYLAHCTNDDCKTFKGNEGNVWVKISELGFNAAAQPQWASDLLRELGAQWSVVIPHAGPGRIPPAPRDPRSPRGRKGHGRPVLPELHADSRDGGWLFSIARRRGVAGRILVALWKVNQGQQKYVAPGGPVWSEAAPDPNRAGPVTVGWIAPMALELAPVIALLENYTKIPIDGDETMYHVGKIWDHWVVAAVCPMIEVSTELSEVTRDCMKSLAFERMLDRSNDVERAAPGTCEWLLRHQQYNAWTTAPGDLGLLWIKGKPGSGKSTLLKHALSQVIPQEKDLVLQFFFHGRGDPLQKSLLGFFRSILHQILRISPQAIPQLISMFEKNQRDIGDVGKKWDWHINHLKHFVESSLPKLLETYTIWLYVDALDECGEDNAVELFDWLQNQSQSAHLRVFITCRHYPILDPDCTVFQICSEDENENDISSYIQRQFSKSPTLMKSQIPDMIARRARGVFMWAHLVVKKAKDLARQRLPLQRIEKEISRTPAELDDLYNDLIADMDDESLKLIRWVCFAEHPFTLDVMRWALAIDPESDYRSLKEYQDQGMVYELEDMETQVMRLSRGLAEVASFKSKYGVLSRGTGIVQFIHQSVKDYF
ncbi:unnamed protein product [Parascedosporium putredinis]|uniref:NACHT domain-containing protein n=1 Tax=Parascedosporium putredinis TaxID=1442378 RepID=A0A9P1HA60_9PEZI|nr:unnamed protein product [Parascedosporium putredinis]CAI8001774.1 unnamed protein product [Parascedosporium putredinis]